MPSNRGAYRYPVNLTGWLNLGDAGETPVDPPGRAPARIVDLSRTGACLRLEAGATGGLAVGLSARLGVDGGSPHSAGPGWVGRIVHESPEPTGGLRVGLAFEGIADLAAWPLALSGGFDGPRHETLTPILATAAGLVVDQATKGWAWGLADGVGLDVIPEVLRVVPIANAGALANLAGDHAWTAPACALAALAVALLPGRFLGFDDREDDTIGRSLATGMVAAGLIGNAADRLALGYVRDFLVSPIWADWAWNLADLFLLAGAGALVLSALRGKPAVGDRPRVEPTPADAWEA